MKKNTMRFIMALGLLGYNYMGTLMALTAKPYLYGGISASIIGVFLMINYFYLMYYEKVIKEFEEGPQ